MRLNSFSVSIAVGILSVANFLSPSCALEFQDGDRVVFLGNTFFERAQASGYLETELTRRRPDLDLTFRNLGWSGDTVFAEARSYFGPAEEGFERLQKHLALIRPTLVLLSYGQNAAYEGADGWDRFAAGLDRLLEAISKVEARVVFVSPTPHEDMGGPFPGVADINENLKFYADKLAGLARERGIPFVDLFTPLSRSVDLEGGAKWTDNGLHYTDYGYWKIARLLAGNLDGDDDESRVIEVDFAAKTCSVSQGRMSSLEIERGLRSLRFEYHDTTLPGPPSPPSLAGGRGILDGGRTLVVRGFPKSGEYMLRIDGEPVAVADGAGWAEGQVIDRGPAFEQVEELRREIVRKNEFFFHRYRPQNETYIFGFRKHEQGNNAVEIPQFDPLVQASEDTIARLRKPVQRQFEILPAQGEKQ